ncbi:Tripartite ATP-independent periplasmic transporters, DctQ component [Falsiruegeria litorea R37]|uniref:TRAP transporter small permease protein n=1 Tax=Falsiruegeria litorea R37 TaxID=1200284 RepID=A0A1Y5RQ51_9RHOB|nr:TRAP transporter small permease [Falsiruegeria litorea]SLN22471.1 Tripartite ATP-independent periplasmic transporters, DctQ component [Falsiruegeria litorea R37]
MLQTIAKVVDGVSETFGIIAGWMFFAVGLFVAYEVFMRYALTSPTVWVDEIARIFQVWGTFAATAYVLKHRQHIIIDLSFRNPDTLGRRLVETFSLLVVVFFGCVAAKYGWDIWLKSTLAGHTTDSYLAVPKMFTQSAIWVGFGLLALQALVEIYQVWAGQTNPQHSDSGEH